MTGVGPIADVVEVSVDELRHAAAWWDEHTTDLVRRVRDEPDAAEALRARHDRGPNWTQLTGSSLPPVSLPVPAWLDELDPEWQTRRAQLATAGHGAAPKLRTIANNYQITDTYIAAMIAAGDTERGGIGPPLDTAGHDDTTSAARLSVRSGPTQLDDAVALWRVRAESAAAICDELERPVTETWVGTARDAYTRWLTVHRAHWRALAADADRIHHALCDHDLPDTPGGRARPAAIAPRLTPADDLPDAAVVPVPDRTPTPPVVDDDPAPDLLPDRPDHPGDHHDGTSANQNREHDRTADGGDAESSGPEPSSSAPSNPDPGSPSPGSSDPGSSATPTGERSTGLLWRGLPTYLPGDPQPEPDNIHGPGDGAPAEPARPADAVTADAPQSPSPSQPDAHEDEPRDEPGGPDDLRYYGGGKGEHPSGSNYLRDNHIGTQLSPSVETPAPSPIVVINNEANGATGAAVTAGAASSMAAAAAIAALVQQDRAVHVIGSLGPPPSIPTATAAPAVPAILGPAPRSTPPVLSAPSASRALHGASMHDLGAPSPSDRSAWDGRSSAAQSPPPAQAVEVPAQRRPNGQFPRTTPRRTAPARPGWPGPSDDAPTETIPVVSGPGAHPRRILVSLGAQRETHDDTAAGRNSEVDVMVDLAGTAGLGLHGPGAADIARTILARLFARPGDPPQIIMPATVLHRLLDNADLPEPTASLVLTDGPFRALGRLDDEIAHRSRHPSGRPLVLFLPAPRDDRTSGHLRTQLAEARTRTGGAVLLGAWPWGTTLAIADDHTVGHHTVSEQPAATPATRHGLGDLTGHRLAPTAPADLSAILQTHMRPAAWASAAEPPPEPLPEQAADAASRQPATTPSTDTGPADIAEHTSAPTGTETTDPTGPALPAEPDTTGPQLRTEPEPDRIDEPTADDLDSAGPLDNKPTGEAPAPLVLRVFGEITLHLRTDPDDPDVLCELPLTGRAQAVLAFLACKPKRGATQRELVAKLWPDSKATRTDGPLHTTLTQLRKITRNATRTADLVPVELHGKHYRLSSVEVDYWDFLAAAKTVVSTPSSPDHAACEQVIRLYSGSLAKGHHGEWLDKDRPRATHLYLIAIAQLVREVADTDPDRAISLLEKARDHEEDNNFIYYNIMRLHYQAGRHDAAAATYDHLCLVLDDLGAKPDPPTRALALQIQRARAASA